MYYKDVKSIFLKDITISDFLFDVVRRVSISGEYER